MTDTVIKGTHNSRSILGAMDIPESWPEALAQLKSTGWLIDLGPLNDAGVQTRGMDLNKANLLSDATAALYGKGDNASPDDILAAIAPYLQQIGEKAKIETGSYIGTGEVGVNYPNSIAFSFPIKIASVFAEKLSNGGFSFNYTSSNNIWLLSKNFMTTTFSRNKGFGKLSSSDGPWGKISPDGKIIHWYYSGTTYPGNQYNVEGSTYYYFAIG